MTDHDHSEGVIFSCGNKTHRGLMVLFGRELVRPKKAPEEFSRLLSRLSAIREKVDCGSVSREDLEAHREQTREMVRRAVARRKE